MRETQKHWPSRDSLEAAIVIDEAEHSPLTSVSLASDSEEYERLIGVSDGLPIWLILKEVTLFSICDTI